MANPLLPVRHKQQDFFSCDVFDTYKDDMASMEHPVFSLSTKPDFRVLEYESNGNRIKITPSYEKGLATIHDKDVLLYIASSLVNRINKGEEPSQTVRFIAYDFLVSTNRQTGGKGYKILKEALGRLVGTRIETNIRTKQSRVIENFGILDSFKIVEKNPDNGRMVGIEVKLSDWFYNSILGKEVLTIDKEYFRLRKPTERRLYELARKHCGQQKSWCIGLETLRNKLGATAPVVKLKFNLNKIAESNHLPGYLISINSDVVTFTRKTSKEVTRVSVPPVDERIIELLKYHGISPRIISELVVQFDSDRITGNINYVLDQDKLGKVKNKKAYLVKAIREDYRPVESQYDVFQVEQDAVLCQNKRDEATREKLKKDWIKFCSKRVKDKFSEMPEKWQEKKRQTFIDKMVLTNDKTILKSYKKDGFKSPIVLGVFYAQIKDEVLTEIEEIDFEEYAKKVK
ncbi:RepB family plasmid replication initiator protein [Methylococcaceae bacterium CS1]|nr:replication initiator protein A [Sulfurovaceae bacterium]TXK94258.1 RepB family plasmid replication initiator protein [Methylococcaceae bacterium CS4]TXK94661.1 RepB family plasmid replication initiator protein [Methylococcaceae bacterium CS5]TXL03177.1 RepB family plasmid replication initiator protein [Methylococcaceae bacterium CS1]TXL03364.1 RepB family plasmid replication initiator protein [Methylococcaceae bacterium CS3]TXL07620.1 RepB family plasmid replication initiator protein [Meth